MHDRKHIDITFETTKCRHRRFWFFQPCIFSSWIFDKHPELNLTSVSQVAQLHLHWGAIDTEGSEHLLDGIRYPAEAHLVTSYGDGSKYAVINRFFTIVSIWVDQDVSRGIAGSTTATKKIALRKTNGRFESLIAPWIPNVGLYPM